MKKSFGKKIKQFREKSGYSQKEMAEIFDVSPNAVFKWENGSLQQ